MQRAPDMVDAETERFKPCFVTKPEPQEVPESDWARFCCRVTGYPKPRVMWLLNGHTVINVSTQHTLEKIPDSPTKLCMILACVTCS